MVHRLTTVYACLRHVMGNTTTGHVHGTLRTRIARSGGDRWCCSFDFRCVREGWRPARPHERFILWVRVLTPGFDIGPSKLPELGKELGKTAKSFKEAAREFETELKSEMEMASKEEDEQKTTSSDSGENKS